MSDKSSAEIQVKLLSDIRLTLRFFSVLFWYVVYFSVLYCALLSFLYGAAIPLQKEKVSHNTFILILLSIKVQQRREKPVWCLCCLINNYWVLCDYECDLKKLFCSSPVEYSLHWERHTVSKRQMSNSRQKANR